ncbi:MAG: UDP-N-acetylglucosamine--N-acetylmuramyl-(pentapeptide) pyrophosphoryl-undecaprenol N-acetylglucosamine transferase [Pseudomonadota bacterium]
MSRYALLATGGSGGHVFPAVALGRRLSNHGWRVDYMIDSRVQHMLAKAVPREAIKRIHAKSPSAGFGRFSAVFLLGWGFLGAFVRMVIRRPDVVVGFGSYASVPPLAAAVVLCVPIVLHEQNAISGRANRLFARFARAVAICYPKPQGLSSARWVVRTGSPVREGFVPTPYPQSTDPLRLVIFGGSQGAKVFSQVFPQAFHQLPERLRMRLSIHQQAAYKDIEKLERIYQDSGIHAEIVPFIHDMPEQLVRAHLVICRAGATTLCELAQVGRPALLVPYRYTLDGDQTANAAYLASLGCVWVLREEHLTATRAAKQLTQILSDRDDLARRAKIITSQSAQDALTHLYDVVQSCVAKQSHHADTTSNNKKTPVS